MTCHNGLILSILYIILDICNITYVLLYYSILYYVIMLLTSDLYCLILILILILYLVDAHIYFI